MEFLIFFIKALIGKNIVMGKCKGTNYVYTKIDLNLKIIYQLVYLKNVLYGSAFVWYDTFYTIVYFLKNITFKVNVKMWCHMVIIKVTEFNPVCIIDKKQMYFYLWWLFTLINIDRWENVKKFCQGASNSSSSDSMFWYSLVVF